MKSKLMPLAGVVLVLMATGCGCISDNELYDRICRSRRWGPPAYGKFDQILIPGLSGAGLFCAGAGDLVESPRTIRVDGLKKRIPVKYVCKSHSHQVATLRKGHVIAYAVIRPEVDACSVCDGSEDCIAKQCVIGYHIEIEYLNPVECKK